MHFPSVSDFPLFPKKINVSDSVENFHNFHSVFHIGNIWVLIRAVETHLKKTYIGFLGFLIFKSKFLLFRVKLCKFRPI